MNPLRKPPFTERVFVAKLSVAPGIIDTPLYTEEMHPFLRTLQPVGRIGRVEEVANAVLHLADATFTTGVILPVDGGMSAGRY